jgi:hypothetical protein
MNKFGKLEPKYSFAINPYKDLRASKCLQCRKKTFKRKFPLLVLSEHAPAIVLGFTCVYCAKCEIIIVHKEDFERELFKAFDKTSPKAKLHEYFVVGTFDKSIWKENLSNTGASHDMQNNVSDFKVQFNIGSSPGGWSK